MLHAARSVACGAAGNRRASGCSRADCSWYDFWSIWDAPAVYVGAENGFEHETSCLMDRCVFVNNTNTNGKPGPNGFKGGVIAADAVCHVGLRNYTFIDSYGARVGMVDLQTTIYSNPTIYVRFTACVISRAFDVMSFCAACGCLRSGAQAACTQAGGIMHSHRWDRFSCCSMSRRTAVWQSHEREWRHSMRLGSPSSEQYLCGAVQFYRYETQWYEKSLRMRRAPHILGGGRSPWLSLTNATFLDTQQVTRPHVLMAQGADSNPALLAVSWRHAQHQGRCCCSQHLSPASVAPTGIPH